MSRSRLLVVSGGLLALIALPAGAQNFMVQCPGSTLLHPNAPTSTQGEPAYTGPSALSASTNGTTLSYTSNGGAIKCQQISGGDGFMTEGDGNQTFMFSFGPLSGLKKIQNGQPGTDFPDEFNQPYCNGASYQNGQPNPYSGNCGPNGAVGYVAPAAYRAANVTAVVGNNTAACTVSPTQRCGVSGFLINDPGAGYTSAPSVALSGGGGSGATASAVIANGSIAEIAVTNPGSGYTTAPTVTLTSTGPNSSISGTDAAAIMNTGVMNGNIPGPLMAFDEDDEFFLTLTNVGMIMRPDLFETHTVHFHGYPNASSFYDGVPDASLAINIGASFTYYYLAPDAGTYFWHCHITPPEHLQMGMVGQLFVRPRQNRAPVGTALPTVSQQQQGDLRTACYSNGESNLRLGATGAPTADILCSTPAPVALAAGATAPTVQAAAANAPCKGPAGQACYVYNDGDGSTFYDVDVPLQIHGFDPNFHFVGMTFNAEGFSDMKDKYFLLNGRSYPDTVTTGAISTQGSDAQSRPSQPLPSLITLSLSGGLNGGPQRAALRIADLDVAEYQTLASVGLPMHVVGYNAKLLRDQAGNNLYYTTNSITLGGGESLDVIIDACAVRGPAPTYACTRPVPAGTYFLYTPNLDHLSNDAENFGGLMTEVVVTP
jgi:FtsP/CotA-like multicopper oxidase with cupredoxin domain